jgi:uncharacterized RDD family membrane protein YckC
MTNPYAPPIAVVQDITDPRAQVVAADRGTRLGAAILDPLIFGAMVYLPLVAGVLTGASALRSAPDGNGGAVLGVGFLLALVGFIVWCSLTIKYMRHNGQSMAKKLLGIKVVRTDGTPVSLGRLIWLRNVVNGVISLIPLYQFLDALFIFGESRQCLHDRLADTIVVKA